MLCSLFDLSIGALSAHADAQLLKSGKSLHLVYVPITISLKGQNDPFFVGKLTKIKEIPKVFGTL